MNNQHLLKLIDSEIKECNQCVQARTESFPPDSFLIHYEKNHITKLGILTKGKAILYCIDMDGNRNILEYLEEGSIFGEFFAFSNTTYSFAIQATTECKVLQIQYDFIIHRCARACEHHANIISLLFQIMALKSTQLRQHLDILSQRNIRSKLLKYFSYVKNESTSQTDYFILPISWTELSDYLCVERTSMMREIKKMEKEGIIVDRNRTKILLSDKFYDF